MCIHISLQIQISLSLHSFHGNSLQHTCMTFPRIMSWNKWELLDHSNIDLETVPVGYRVFVVLRYAQTTGKCAVALQPVDLCCF